MTSRDFCYWLQGFFEISMVNDPGSNVPIDGHLKLTNGQVEMIRRHLRMVFIHEIDPSFPAHQQEALNNAHKGDAIQQYYRNGDPDDNIQAMC